MSVSDENFFSEDKKHQLCAYIDTDRPILSGDIGLKLTYQPCKQYKKKDDNENRIWNEFFVKCHLRPKLKPSKKHFQNCIFISSILAKCYEIRLGDKVQISRLSFEDFECFNGKIVVDKHLSSLCQPFLLNDEAKICHPNLKLQVSEGNFYGNIPQESNEIESDSSDCDTDSKVVIENDVIHDMKRILQRALKLGRQSNVILHGDSGSGKSTVLKQIQHFFQKVL